MRQWRQPSERRSWFRRDQPDYGFLLDTMIVPSRGTLAFESLIQPRIEPEIAFWLASDLHGPGVTLEQVIQATRGVSAALEVVDSRIINWRIALVDTIADNASSARVIVSEQLFPIDAFDLAKVSVTMTRNGEGVGWGTAGELPCPSPGDTGIFSLAGTTLNDRSSHHKGL